MGQNRSSAVMQQRAEPHDSLDYFPTPPWATRALCEWLPRGGKRSDLSKMVVEEPACGEGHMARPLGEYFGAVRASDVHDYGDNEVVDYLLPRARPDFDDLAEFSVTNPPFKLAEPFIQTMLANCWDMAWVLVRSSFLEGGGRYLSLFRDAPPAYQLVFSGRVVMWKGRLLDPDRPIRRWNARIQKYEVKKPTSATSYCWLGWRSSHRSALDITRTYWIDPGARQALTRPGDYPPLPPELDPDVPLPDTDAPQAPPTFWSGGAA